MDARTLGGSGNASTSVAGFGCASSCAAQQTKSTKPSYPGRPPSIILYHGDGCGRFMT